ncbi:Pectate lyase [Heracleum sosnowskyi]|uniref:Pectate lyase n=1 Tax=Heracleum sosnowskyi TaxID=360622 RepID=A0AAD8IDA8_9APIA|nr:Pectate lyase [Heracleum sosnowskyi]
MRMMRMLSFTCILIFCLLTTLSPLIQATAFNQTLPHPDPEAVALHVQRRILAATVSKAQQSCGTGNPIDDCWRCDPNWSNNRQRLAECGIGFGQAAAGGKGGQIYVVTDSSDHDVENPTPGTLRHAVIQTEPLWIVFSANMQIKLKEELIVNSYKTIDGRGANIYITGGGCITLHNVSNVIIHNIHVYNCVPSGNTNIRSSPTHVEQRGKTDGDGITIFGSRNIWIDHCALSHCTDGLIDVTMGSTAITISNNYFSHHDEVMLMGHDDDYLPDKGMQVTIAFNHFGQGLKQRMPRCRHGYFHVVNNDFTEWKMYAIGGSASPTINSQGNRFMAPPDPSAKQVTRRVDAKKGDWAKWNWRSDGDIFENGAYFVPSGLGLSKKYVKAASVQPKSAAMIDQLTSTAGVLGGPRDNGDRVFFSGGTTSGASGSGGRSGPRSTTSSSSSIFLWILIILVLYITTSDGTLLLV